MFFNRFWWENVFWASKKQVFSISGAGFRKPKNQRRTQVEKMGIFLKIFQKFLETFTPLFFHFPELYDDITRFSTENNVSIAITWS